MEIYDGRFFVINKRLLMSSGLWPYQDARKKFFMRIVLGIVLFTMFMPQVLSLCMHYRSVDKVIEILAVLLFIAALSLKSITTIICENKLKAVLDSVAVNWTKITDAQEKSILIEFSERGRKLTLGYITYMITALMAFITLPMTPIVLNALRPLNASRPRLYLLNGEFHIDKEAHYWKICGFELLNCITSAYIIISVDTLYAACIEHCLGLFAIVQYRLKTYSRHGFEEIGKGVARKDRSYDLIVKAIQMHNEIINFSSILESSYSTSFLFLVGLNMIIFSVTSVLVLIKLDQILEFIRFGMIWVGMLVHLFYVSWPGQKLIDHSGGLFRDSYMNEWYESSIRSQKLLQFVTLRSSKPCSMSAGGMYVMNFANFLLIIKSSMSYITLFSSLR